VTQPIELFGRRRQGMHPTERLMLTGLLARLQPKLALEIGTFNGGSLEFLEAWADEVVSFDLEPQVDPSEFPKTIFHAGDSRVLLPEVLARLAEAGRNVDFALVDGDHSAEGVRADVEALLASPAVDSTLIVLHDTMNEEVREGIARARPEKRPGVVHVDLDLLEVFSDKGPFSERWSGLGVIVVERHGRNGVEPLPSASHRRQSKPLAALWELAVPARRARRAVTPSAVRLFRRLPPRVQTALRRRRETPWRRPSELEQVEAPSAPVRR
jgi:hypothetical protein